MENRDFENVLNALKTEYSKKESMRNHTTFKIGGFADYFIWVKSEEELCRIIKELKALEMPFFIIGKGSNILASDKGVDGAVLSLSGMSGITVKGDEITAMAGASLAGVCLAALEASLEGLEFVYGIPGSVGGALYMNAGAYGGEMSQAVASADYVTVDGERHTANNADMLLGYRNSIFRNGGMIITSVKFKLRRGDAAEIRLRMDDFLNRRKSKQPLEYPSAGSTFKRPCGNFAGALIEKNSLKGVSIGGAKVSEKHAGFIINYNNASSDDVKRLIEYVKAEVLKADGISLEPEVIFVGRE